VNVSGGIRLVVKKAFETDVYRDIARVPEIHRKDQTGRTVPEGSVCKLSTPGRSVYVLLRGVGDETEAGIWLDERTRNRLSLSVGHQAEFEFHPCGLWGQTCWAWSASDPSYRVAARLAVLSVLLGVVGLFLGLWSIWLSAVR